jgi:uncharacterized protein involved in cysteine biosynthesis
LASHQPYPTAGFDPNRRPGFAAGFVSVLHSGVFLLRTPRLWPASLVPSVILLLLTTALVTLSFALLVPLVSAWLPASAEWSWRPEGNFWAWLVDNLRSVSEWLLPWLAAILASLIGFVVALAITPPLSAPALEHIVAVRERSLELPERQPVGFAAEMWCGLKAQMWAGVFALPLLLLLGLVDLLFPVAAIATIPVKCLVLSVSLAWNLFDYPLTLRAVPMRDRLAMLRAHWRPTLGFGLAFSALFWIPCFGVLLLPVGVVGATTLLWWILLFDPAVAPTVPRPSGRRPRTQATAMQPPPR